MKLKTFFSVLLLVATTAVVEAKQKFKPTVSSLQQYECPEWFRDAKFGIWSCWNAYTVAGAGDWYARNMYIQGHRQYEYHVKTFGHPSKFGYKDVVDLWKGENFNAKEQIALFKKAGAKYFIAMANHHDNFDLWDSKYQKWNSVNYGPKRDIIKEWREATLEAGLRWGVTSHLERTWSWFQTNKLSDKTGEYKGVPYDGNDPKNEFMYLPYCEDTSHTQPVNATKWWREHWYNRCVDLIDNYKPDLFYVDGGVPFPGDDKGETGLKMISHLYNQNSSWHNGQNEAVMCIKNWLKVAPKGEWGHYWEGIGTLDFERGRSSVIMAEPFQTDTHAGSWSWSPNLKYRAAVEIIKEIVDIVAKNGNLLLNITPRPDGKLDEGSIKLLTDLGSWFSVNGESIYETRPWLISGSGNLRVVQKRGVLYVTSLVKPEGKTLLVPFFGAPKGDAKIQKVTLLGCDNPLEFTQSDKGLQISLPSKGFDSTYPWAFKIEGVSLNSYDVAKFEVKASSVEEDVKVWYEIAHKKSADKVSKAISFDKNGDKWFTKADGTLCKSGDGNVVEFPYKVNDVDVTTNGFSSFVTLSGELYVGENEKWSKVSNVELAHRVSVSESGVTWAIDALGTLWQVKEGKVFQTVKIPAGCLDVTVSNKNNSGGVVTSDTKIMFINNDVAGKPSNTTKVTRIDFTPKTNHLITIYDGELAINRWGCWLFTGKKATEIGSGKVNDDEMIGWVEK